MPRKPENLTGRRFGLRVVLYQVDALRWMCRCDCGAETIARANNLRAGTADSCGCQKGRVRPTLYIHHCPEAPPNIRCVSAVPDGPRRFIVFGPLQRSGSQTALFQADTLADALAWLESHPQK